MKKYLIIAGILLGLIIAVIGLSARVATLSQQNKTHIEEYTQALSYLDTLKETNGTLYLDKQQWLKEKDALYKKIDSLTHIKPKTVTRIVEVKSNTIIHDSIYTRDTFFLKQLDTNFITKHYNIGLSIEPPSKASVSVQIPTDIQVTTYRKKVRQKGCWGWLKRRLVIEENTVTTTNPYIQINDTKFIELK